MGNCTSCLGRAKKDDYDEDEEHRLLFDDPANYGSFTEQNVPSHDNAMEAQREIEALQRVVSKTSENMVDIFEIAPQNHSPRTGPTRFGYAGQEARIVRYKTLLSKLAANGEDGDGVQVEWLPQEDDTIELQRSNVPTAWSDTDKPLVGTFADAAAAMG